MSNNEIYYNIGTYRDRDYSDYEISNFGHVRNANTHKLIKLQSKTYEEDKTYYYFMLIPADNKLTGKARIIERNNLMMHVIGNFNKELLDYNVTGSRGTINTNQIGATPAKQVYCITNDTIYSSIKEAARELAIPNYAISACCNKKQHSTKGYQFEFYYEGDVSTMTNDIKLEGTIVSKVNKAELKSGSKIANFILKTDGEHPIHVMVKFVGKRDIELEKGQHIWLKGSLANMRRKDGSYEIGISATAYKVHDNNHIQSKPNTDLLDSIQVESDPEPTGFKGVLPKRRR